MGCVTELKRQQSLMSAAAEQRKLLAEKKRIAEEKKKQQERELLRSQMEAANRKAFFFFFYFTLIHFTSLTLCFTSFKQPLFHCRIYSTDLSSHTMITLCVCYIIYRIIARHGRKIEVKETSVNYVER